MRISSDLLKILVCPITKGKLIYDEAMQELISPTAGVAFPIIDNIPILLESEARAVSSSRIKDLLEKHKDSLEKEEN